jgi:hypothetical protein
MLSVGIQYAGSLSAARLFLARKVHLHAMLQVPVLPSFQQDQAPSHPSNSQVLHVLADAALPEPVCRAYGPWLVGQVVVARAELLLVLGATHDCYTRAQLDGEVQSRHSVMLALECHPALKRC